MKATVGTIFRVLQRENSERIRTRNDRRLV